MTAPTVVCETVWPTGHTPRTAAALSAALQAAETPEEYVWVFVVDGEETRVRSTDSRLEEAGHCVVQLGLLHDVTLLSKSDIATCEVALRLLRKLAATRCPWVHQASVFSMQACQQHDARLLVAKARRLARSYTESATTTAQEMEDVAVLLAATSPWGHRARAHWHTLEAKQDPGRSGAHLLAASQHIAEIAAHAEHRTYAADWRKYVWDKAYIDGAQPPVYETLPAPRTHPADAERRLFARTITGTRERR